MTKASRLKRWLVVRWPGPIPATGFSLGIGEFAGRMFWHRPIDPEVIPFAVALILWRPLRDHQERRNEGRDLDL
jgi:hypothetical protein